MVQTDANLDERIMLVARDEQSCLVVSYREIRSSIDEAYKYASVRLMIVTSKANKSPSQRITLAIDQHPLRSTATQTERSFPRALPQDRIGQVQ